jgi:hypothetical protein
MWASLWASGGEDGVEDAEPVLAGDLGHDGAGRHTGDRLEQVGVAAGVNGEAAAAADEVEAYVVWASLYEPRAPHEQARAFISATQPL